MSELMDWRQAANCTELLEGDPETFDEYFFPEAPDRAVTKMAKKICSFCPVRLECLNDAQQTGDVSGIRGGLTARERSKLDIPRQRSSYETQ